MTSSQSQEPSPKSPADQGEAWIDEQLGRLTPRQKLAQRLVVLPGVAGGRPDEDTRAALAAGLGVLHGLTDLSVSAAARYHVEVAEIAGELGLPPALVSANLESGVGYTLGGGGTDFPYPRGIGHSDDPLLARRMAEEAAREARLAGFHWTFSPCVDVLTTSDDPILGVRAFGLDADRTAVLGAAQIRGYQDGGLLATAKHFPGHGDSTKDTHAEAAPLARTREEHELRHLPPFHAAIEAGAASIMVAHVALPGLGVPGPASLSPLVNRTWLRAELGYDGLIVTDSLRMGAIAATWPAEAAAVAALAAGADIANVKCPAGEVPSILDALEAALAYGELDGDELDRSVARLLRAKARLGLHREHGVDPVRCEELDSGRSWADPGLATTVSAWLPEPVRGPVVVVGDSELAKSLANALAQGEVTYEPLSSPVEAARAHPGATVMAVTCPLPVDGGRDSAEFAASVETARTAGRPVIAVVNSVVPADGLRVAGPAVSVPAVDAFGIVSGAAVAAAAEVLG